GGDCQGARNPHAGAVIPGGHPEPHDISLDGSPGGSHGVRVVCRSDDDSMPRKVRVLPCERQRDHSAIRSSDHGPNAVYTQLPEQRGAHGRLITRVYAREPLGTRRAGLTPAAQVVEGENAVPLGVYGASASNSELPPAGGGVVRAGGSVASCGDPAEHQDCRSVGRAEQPVRHGYVRELPAPLERKPVQHPDLSAHDRNVAPDVSCPLLHDLVAHMPTRSYPKVWGLAASASASGASCRPHPCRCLP